MTNADTPLGVEATTSRSEMGVSGRARQAFCQPYFHMKGQAVGGV